MKLLTADRRYYSRESLNHFLARTFGSEMRFSTNVHNDKYITFEAPRDLTREEWKQARRQHVVANAIAPTAMRSMNTAHGCADRFDSVEEEPEPPRIDITITVSELSSRSQNEDSERESAQHVDLATYVPQEERILVSLHDTILKNFRVLLRLVNEAQSPESSNTCAGEPATTTSPGDGMLGTRSELLGPNNSDSLVASQNERLQRAFIRFSMWGRDFNVASGALDTKLEYSEELREDVILVLLHLCDAIYLGLPLLTTTTNTIDRTDKQSTVRLLEIAQSYIEENDYLGVDDTSFATIIEEILSATEGLGDLSFCLEAPALDFPAIQETPRPPHEVGTTDPHRVYEEMIRHRFPKADPIAISQHATANYYRFITLQGLRKEAEDEESQPEPDEKALTPLPTHLVDAETRTVSRTVFHDSGIGTSHRHESSYAKSLMSFTRRSAEQYVKLLPKLPDAGASGRRFDCVVCLRKVQFANESLWTAHVLEDLLPYVCIVHDCLKSTEPFGTRNMWLDHLKFKHDLDKTTTSMTCNLCAEVVGSDHMLAIAHMENHLIEIALSVLPTGEDHEDEEVVESDELEPSPQISLVAQSGIGEAAPELAEAGSQFLDTVSDDNPNGSNISNKKSPNSLTRRRTKASKDSESNSVAAKLQRVARGTKDKTTSSDARTFPCLLTHYGCADTFSSKNVWKRHHSTQHFKLSFWRCDLCPPTADPNDPRVIYYNDFNRKDLFTQHLRRMHAAPRDDSRTDDRWPVNEENLAAHQARCHKTLREPPQDVSCMICDRTFSGSTAWEEYIEHAGRHIEKDIGVPTQEARKGADDWRCDERLEAYMLEEGLVVQESDGSWAISDGKPLRKFNNPYGTTT